MFQVIGSPKVGVLFDDPQLFTSQLEGMKQIERLNIEYCNSLTSLPFSILPSTLKRIRISRCPKLKLELPVGEMISSMFVEYLTLQECDCIDDISPELLPRARSLSVERCHNLTRFLIPTATENVEKLSAAFGMTYLNIQGCEKLKWLPERMQELLPSLKTLYLYKCPEIESFPERGLPFNLQVLEIRHCKKLENGRKEWRLQRLPCLKELAIHHDGSDEEILAGENWELPSSIQTLTISNLKTLSTQVLKSLTSLQSLCIANLPQIQSMLEEGHLSHLSELTIGDCRNLQSLSESALPSSLSQLTIWDCPNLQSLSESALPSSLSQLTIINCPNLQSLSESALPSSLSQLTIIICRNLQSLSESALPSSLSTLTIINCRNLQSLSESALPSSLSVLSISNCPFLKPLLEFEKGECWPEIAHISTIKIDEEYL